MSVINWPPGSGSGGQDYGSADRKEMWIRSPVFDTDNCSKKIPLTREGDVGKGRGCRSWRQPSRSVQHSWSRCEQPWRPRAATPVTLGQPEHLYISLLLICGGPPYIFRSADLVTRPDSFQANVGSGHRTRVLYINRWTHNHEGPRRRITVTSFLNEISTNQLKNRVRGGRRFSARLQPFPQRFSGQIEDDLISFSQCRRSGSGIRCLFDAWIRDPGWVKNKDPDPGWTSRVIFPRA